MLLDVLAGVAHDAEVRLMRVLFVNENIGGHATVHAHLRAALAARPDVDARFLDVPPASGLPASGGGAGPRARRARP